MIAFIFRFIFLAGSFSSDDFPHKWRFHTRNKLGTPFNYLPILSVLDGKVGYPQLFHYFISLLPEKHWQFGARIANIIIDVLVIVATCFFAYYFFAYFGFDSNKSLIPLHIYASLLLATSPILLPVTSRMKSMGARVFGYFLYCLFVVFNYLILSGLLIIGTIGSFVTLIFIILSSQFAMQASIWTSFVISIGFLNPFPFLLTCLTFVFAWKSNRFGTHDVLSAKIAHWRWYFRNAQSGTSATDRNKLIDYLCLPLWLVQEPQKAIKLIFTKSVPIIVLYSVPPFFLLIWMFISDLSLLEVILSEPLTKFLFWVTMAAAFACLFTSLKPLLFLGQAERYFEYAMPSVAVLYVYAIAASGRSETWLLYVVFFQVIGVLANYLYSNKASLKSSLLGEVEPAFQELIKFLNTKEHLKVITIPTKIAFRLAVSVRTKHDYYYRFINRNQGGHDYMEEDHAAFDLIKPDFEYFNKKYGVDTVVISKKHFKSAEKRGIKYKIYDQDVIFENYDYIVLYLKKNK